MPFITFNADRLRLVASNHLSSPSIIYLIYINALPGICKAVGVSMSTLGLLLMYLSESHRL